MMQQLDHETSEALHHMLRYINDDRRIASHLAIPVERVAAARKRVRKGQVARAVSRQDADVPHSVGAPDRWQQDLRRAVTQLAEAIAEARG